LLAQNISKFHSLCIGEEFRIFPVPQLMRERKKEREKGREREREREKESSEGMVLMFLIQTHEVPQSIYRGRAQNLSKYYSL